MKSNLKIRKLTEKFMRQQLASADTTHDWWHTERVWQMAKKISEVEGGDGLVIELAALLHDVADAKLNSGNEELGLRKTKNFLDTLGLPQSVVEAIQLIIGNLSFRNEEQAKDIKMLELDIVRDADRLDAIGAIGIARAFNYGGSVGRAIYDPNIQPKLGMTKQQYQQAKSPTINHFYEKLLTIKDLMRTKTGKKLATCRHKILEGFLQEFENEINF